MSDTPDQNQQPVEIIDGQLGNAVTARAGERRVIAYARRKAEAILEGGDPEQPDLGHVALSTDEAGPAEPDEPVADVIDLQSRRKDVEPVKPPATLEQRQAKNEALRREAIAKGQPVRSSTGGSYLDQAARAAQGESTHSPPER